MFTDEQLEEVKKIYPEAKLSFDKIDCGMVDWNLNFDKYSGNYVIDIEDVWSSIFVESKDFNKILNILRAIKECEE